MAKTVEFSICTNKKERKKTVGESVFFLAISLTLLGEMSSMIVKIDALAGSQLCYICCSLYTLHTAVYATVPTESPKKCGDQWNIISRRRFCFYHGQNLGGDKGLPPWHSPVPPSLHHTESTQKRHSERQEH